MDSILSSSPKNHLRETHPAIPSHRVALAVASIAFAAYYIIMATILRYRILIDPDIFLHIRVGSSILQSGHFPVHDHFSYTAFGRPWLATDWISEIIFATLYRMGQWLAVTEIVAITVGLIAGYLSFYLARRLRLSVALGLTAVIVLMISPHFLARPVIFSYLLLLVWILLILEIEDRQEWDGPGAFILSPVILLWANVHGSFTLGLAIFYLFAGNAIYTAYLEKGWQRTRRLITLIVGVTVAALITPYGIFSALRTATLLNIPALSDINEWHAPDFQADRFHLFFIVGLFALLLYFGIRLRGPRLLTILLVTVFALEHKRGLGLFSLIAPLLVIGPLTKSMPWIGIPGDTADPVARFAVRRSGAIGVACIMVGAITGFMVWTLKPRVQPPNRVAPEMAVTAAKNANLLGSNVFNNYDFGEYLIFKGIPTFVDGRVGLYGNQFLQRYFASVKLTDPNTAIQLLKQYNVRWALLSPSEPIVFMLQADGWKELYKDHDAIVLAKGS
jgi:hypothetical protein